jgi:hypothetical protein
VLQLSQHGHLHADGVSQLTLGRRQQQLVHLWGSTPTRS